MPHILPLRLFWSLVRPRVESIVLGFAVVIGVFLVSGNDHVFAQGGTWVTKTPMPTARNSFAAAGIAGKLYVAGGSFSCCDANYLDTLEVYDPATDTWTTKAPMPEARGGVGSAVIGGKLYVVGGRIPGLDVATLEVYDPVTNVWATKHPMPTPRRGLAVEAIDGLLYVAGGEQESPGPGDLSILEVYDPATDSWTTKASLPSPRTGMASGVIDGKLYLAGGRTNGEASATLLVYHPGTDTWTEKTPMPTARWVPVGAVIESEFYVVAGAADEPPLETVEVYDPATDTWRAAAPIPTGRWFAGEAGVIAGKLYVVGGWTCFGCDIATLEVFEPLEIVNSELSGIPDPDTFSFDPTPVPNGPAGTFSFTAEFCNVGNTPLTQLKSVTTVLTGGNVLLNRDSNTPPSVGAELAFPANGGYADRMLTGGECVAVDYVIGLARRAPFEFVVNILGIV